MKFERVAIPLAPRTTLNCLDLALCFIRTFLKPISGLWATVALPSCTLVYLLMMYYDCTLTTALIVLFAATSPLGVLLMTGAAPATFGERFSYGGTMRRLWGKGAWLVAKGLLFRIVIAAGIFLIIVPGWYFAVRTGFFVEQAALSGMARHLHDRRADELLKGEFGDLLGRSAVIAIYSFVVAFVLLFTIDAASSALLGLPILWGRINLDSNYVSDFSSRMGYLFRFLGTDPIAGASFVAVGLWAYILGRLAWFFCYIDVRVRRDCWDMELQFIQEAQRLEAV